jgi:two-component system sensor histidine kinase MprB
MSYRGRIVLLTASAVALAILLASVATYVTVRDRELERIDDGLRALAGDVITAPRNTLPSTGGRPALRFDLVAPREQGREVVLVLPSTPLGSNGGYAQSVRSSGRIERPTGRRVDLPAGPRVRAVAAGRAEEFFYDAKLEGEDVRVFVTEFGFGRALQAVRSLEEVNANGRRLALVLALVTLGGAIIAGGLGLVVARSAVRPVRRLTEGAEYVTATRDLRRRVEATGDDELARLARSFNTMLAALEASQRAQRQLVADASHELRTPLTTVIANVEMLARADELPEAEREQLRHDLVTQLQELNTLVGDLVELARETQPETERERFDLAELAADCVQRMRAHAPRLRFETELEPSPMEGAPLRVERAVMNLLDNARKWSSEDGTVHVRVADGELTVRDDGPGIRDEDLPFVFDRFYRAADSRRLPGSGLGLAIVRQVAESHGGAAWASDGRGRGAELHMRLGPSRNADVYEVRKSLTASP